jgi:4-hydroxybenzoate polyprenyltransferase
VDLPVWQEARRALVVNANERLTQQARNRTEVSHVFNEPGSTAGAILKALRPHQWVKNIIIFVPLLTSHKFNQQGPLIKSVLAFLAFSLCASGVYVLNDLSDLESDRHHATKRRRPFASGRLPLPYGFFMLPLTVGLGLGLALMLSWNFLMVLAVYFLMTTGYSWRLKQSALLDVFFLAGLYTMRLVAGQAATGIPNSFWLLVFSMFMFLSLALVKRYTELKTLRLQNKQDSKGRGYRTGDLELVAMLGVASGFMSALVMALYVNSEQGNKMYRRPEVLLLLCPMMLYWISRIWLTAHRDQMHDDPIVFALKDKSSYVMAALTLCVLWLAADHYRWFS